MRLDDKSDIILRQIIQFIKYDAIPWCSWLA